MSQLLFRSQTLLRPPFSVQNKDEALLRLACAHRGTRHQNKQHWNNVTQWAFSNLGRSPIFLVPYLELCCTAEHQWGVMCLRDTLKSHWISCTNSICILSLLSAPTMMRHMQTCQTRLNIGLSTAMAFSGVRNKEQTHINETRQLRYLHLVGLGEVLTFSSNQLVTSMKSGLDFYTLTYQISV